MPEEVASGVEVSYRILRCLMPLGVPSEYASHSASSRRVDFGRRAIGSPIFDQPFHKKHPSGGYGD